MQFTMRKLSKFVRFLVACLFSIGLLAFVYWQSLPQKYDLKVGQVSEYDIVAPHDLVDHNATRLKAIAESGAVSPVFVRSEELSNQALEQLNNYLEQIYATRLATWQAYGLAIDEPLADNLKVALQDFSLDFQADSYSDGIVKSTEPKTTNNETTPPKKIAPAPSSQALDNQTAQTQAPLNNNASKHITTNQTAPTQEKASPNPDDQNEAKVAETVLTANSQTNPLASTKQIKETTTSKEQIALENAKAEKLALAYPSESDLRQLTEDLQQTSKDLGVILPSFYAGEIAKAEPSIFLSLAIEMQITAKAIMSADLNKEKLDIAITRQCRQLVENVNNYADLYAAAAPILRSILTPNLRYDADATKAARITVFERAIKNPIQIHRGTRIVSYNDVITEAQYNNLKELNLLANDEPNFRYLGVLTGLYCFCLVLALVYLKIRGRNYSAARGSNQILVAAALVVLVLTLYTADWSVFLIPLPFFVLISCTYFSGRDSLYLTLLLMLFLALFANNLTAYFFVYSLATLLILLIMGRNRQRSNYIVMLIAAACAMVIASLIYSLFDYQDFFNCLKITCLSLINGLLSALVAVGIIPLLDFAFSAVSPMRLVALAQPDAPLMKRLFMEALGTYQHSMMVANLAENAAQAVGANTLLCRVGAYYHDIGKLKNPLMFTENQDGYNPHDDLSPKSSYDIITDHVRSGQKIARRYRLPQALINIIREHHGTTVLFYFYKKAESEQQKLAMPPVNKEDWRYPWNTPSSREAAIVMLADSLEAAMKSTGYRTVDEMEKLARNIIRDKNSQDQLINSGLSYQDVEDILAAFKRVYAGVFKERVKYPDVSKS